jgi:hypothetical protein
LRKVICSRTYLGEARCGEHLNKEAHEAIVSEDLWERANGAKAPRPSRSETLVGLLAGVVRCACCGYAMKVDRQRTTGSPAIVYRCKGKNARPCTERSCIMRDPVNEFVVREFFRVYAPARSPRDGKVLAAKQAQAERVKARREFETYRDDVSLRESLGDEMWAPGLKVRAEVVRATERTVRETEVLVGADTLRTSWEDMSFDQRRRVLRRGIDAVYVKRAPRGASVADRLRIVWAGEDDGVLGGCEDEIISRVQLA